MYVMYVQYVNLTNTVQYPNHKMNPPPTACHLLFLHTCNNSLVTLETVPENPTRALLEKSPKH